MLVDLTDDEQSALAASSTCCLNTGRRFPFPTRPVSRCLAIATCGNYGFSTRAGRIGCCMPSTRAAMQIILLGGDKTGDNRWYEENVPKADAFYDDHLRQLEEERLI